jgi:hypothetical protein
MLKLVLIETFSEDAHDLATRIDGLRGVADTTVYDGLGQLLLDLHEGLHSAMLSDAVDVLGDWLTDNTDEVFEEQPEVDDLRSALQGIQ